jgi:hypothetical protein
LPVERLDLFGLASKPEPLVMPIDSSAAVSAGYRSRGMNELGRLTGGAPIC